MVSVEKYDCTVLCSDRPNGALTCQSEQEGREWEKTASEAEKRKDTSILRHTHTHTFANELPLVTREKHFVASHSPAAVLVCVCM